MPFFNELKKHRAAILVSVAANVGSCLFGFDTGIAGGVIALRSFRLEFGLDRSLAVRTQASSNIVAILNAGAFVGALAPALLGRHLGRRYMLALAGVLFLIGGILQTAASGPTLAHIYAGRVISGLGVGVISTTAPIFVAETAPKHLRGIMMALFEMCLVSGGMLAYWTTYGCSMNISPTSTAQWRVPLSLQIALAALVIASIFLIPESPRWLAQKNRWSEAEDALRFLRGVQDPEDAELRHEVAEIRAQLECELAIKSGRTVLELFHRRNIRRLLSALGVSFFFMWGGHNGILYYAPTVISQLGFSGQDVSLMASGIFTCVKFLSTAIFITSGLIHMVGRRTLLLSGAVMMGTLLFALGAILSTHQSDTDSSIAAPTRSGLMALLYLFVAAYSFTWGPTPWIYLGEIFPTRIRDYGMGVATANIWVWNLVVAKIMPFAISNLGWKLWMVFGMLNILASVFAWFLPETRGRSLEDMDILFGVIDETTRQEDIEMHINKADREEIIYSTNQVKS